MSENNDRLSDEAGIILEQSVKVFQEMYDVIQKYCDSDLDMRLIFLAVVGAARSIPMAGLENAQSETNQHYFQNIIEKLDDATAAVACKADTTPILDRAKEIVDAMQERGEKWNK